MEHYDVLEVIGEGTYGVVFKCRDKRTNRIVAVKQFKSFESNAYVRVAMLRELRVEQLLKGEPNVTQLLETFKQKNRLYLVMEYIPRSLLDLLEEARHGLPEDSLMVLLFTILLGIRSCHRNGIIHRDVKPENILVRDDGTASLCDFGFCRPLPRELQPQPQQQPHQLSTPSKDVESSASPLTGNSSFGQGSLQSPYSTPQMRNGASTSTANSAVLSELVLADHQAIMTNYVATRWYRSPEMLLGMPSYTYAVDMWAVGAIMAEAIGGEPLLPGKTELEQLSLIQTRIGDFPAAYEAAVRKRNGGMLRTKSAQQKSRRSRDARGGAQENVEAKQGTSLYLTNRYGGRITMAGMDLLHRLLRVDAAERIVVEDALEHPYFDDIRGRFDAAVNGDHAAFSSRDACHKTTEMQATAAHQEPFPPLTATQALHSTSPFFCTPGVAGGGGSPCLEAVAPPLVEVPISLQDMSAEVQDDGGSPLPMPCRAARSPRLTSVAWEASASSSASRAACVVATGDSSLVNSSSFSLWTSSDTSAKVAPPTDVTAEEGHEPLSQLSSVLVPLALESPEVNETITDCAAAARDRAAGDGNSPALRLVLGQVENGDRVVLRPQAARKGTNAHAVQHDASVITEDCSSTSLFQRRQNHHSPRDVRLLRRRTSSLKDSARVRALTRAGSLPMNAFVQEPGGAGGAACEDVVGDMDFSTPLSLSKTRRATKKERDDVMKTRPLPHRGTAANASRTKSPSSLLAQSYSFKSMLASRSKPQEQSLAPTVIEPPSKHRLLHSAREGHAEKLRHLSGPMSAPRNQGSRGGVDKSTAATLNGARPCNNSTGTSIALPSTRGSTGRSGGLASATKERRSSTGKGRDRSVGRVFPPAPSCANEAALATSLRSAAQGLAEISVQRHQGTPILHPSPQRRRRTCTPTGRAGTANGNPHSPAVSKPLFARSPPEVSAALAVSNTRGGGSKSPGHLRYASPQLPCEVRPLPVQERVTLLREIESLSISVGTPSAVEVLVPVAAVPASHRSEYAECGIGSSGGVHGKSQGGITEFPITSAEPVVPTSQPLNQLGSGVRPDEDHCGGDSDSLLTLFETEKQFSAMAVKQDTAASGTSSAPGERTAYSKPEDHGWEKCLQRPPHSGGSTSGCSPRMDSSSLTGIASTHTANDPTGGSCRVARSLIFRSYRTASSPLRLAAIHPFSPTSQREGLPSELSISNHHESFSASTGMSFKTPPNTTNSADTRRLAPALLRHHHFTTAAGGYSLQTPIAVGPDPVFGRSSFSAQSPCVMSSSARSPFLSPVPQQLSGVDGQHALIESQLVSLSGARQQRRLSNPIELSLSGELLEDSASGIPRGGYRGHENSTLLSTTPPTTMHDDLETVVLMETPPTHRQTNQQRQHRVHSSGSWSPTRTGMRVTMSCSMPDNSTTSRGLDRETDESPAHRERKGSVATADVVDPPAGATRHNTIPELFPAAPTHLLECGEDDVINISNTSPLPMRGSLNAFSTVNDISRSSRERVVLSLAPPQPLLGGSSVPSAQQLHAGGGRRKSRLML
ncbi:putative Protein kinase domain/Protein tyrosine kinase [Leishmania naiffi]|uniref:cyclin-dependent kinase n=1 Tax=Leishmania naiffi TaxID=5678 RepID=A0AAW3BG98_9TRYP